jgi:hypothetical protein
MPAGRGRRPASVQTQLTLVMVVVSLTALLALVLSRVDENRRIDSFLAADAKEHGGLLDRALEKKLRAAGSSLSSSAAWQALETVRCVTVEVGNRTKLCVTRGSRQAAEVLKILRLADLDPPKPPEGKETVM